MPSIVKGNERTFSYPVLSVSIAEKSPEPMWSGAGVWRESLSLKDCDSRSLTRGLDIGRLGGRLGVILQ